MFSQSSHQTPRAASSRSAPPSADLRPFAGTPCAFLFFAVNKVVGSKVLLWVAVALLPGAMLLLPLVLVILGRRRASVQTTPSGVQVVPAQAELADLPPASSGSVQLARV